jgi:hypothetical protein
MFDGAKSKWKWEAVLKILAMRSIAEKNRATTTIFPATRRREGNQNKVTKEGLKTP